ncbi:MAG: InlB B-repeat-containing protein [Lachnospiraceae bacterium]|jgi:uncharacterized repeat protein (TIGR02543 family)|nr:InlB B-repeat-containing protein [Lachnospiraceae bacterium]
MAQKSQNKPVISQGGNAPGSCGQNGPSSKAQDTRGAHRLITQGHPLRGRIPMLGAIALLAGIAFFALTNFAIGVAAPGGAQDDPQGTPAATATDGGDGIFHQVSLYVGGVHYDTRFIADGATLDVPPQPLAPQGENTFLGWFAPTGAGGSSGTDAGDTTGGGDALAALGGAPGDAFDFTTPITADIALEARFAQMSTVYFHGNGEPQDALVALTVTVPTGGQVEKPALAITSHKAGYVFNGLWTADPYVANPVVYPFDRTEGETGLLAAIFGDGGSGSGSDATGASGSDTAGGSGSGKSDFSAPVESETLHLYPMYSRGYTVQYNTKGTPVSPQTVYLGEVPRKPADPTREGYTFSHWSVYEDGADPALAYGGAGAGANATGAGAGSASGLDVSGASGSSGAGSNAAGSFAFDVSIDDAYMAGLYGINADGTPARDVLTLYAVWVPELTKYKVNYWLEKPGILPDDYPAPIWVPAGQEIPMVEAALSEAQLHDKNNFQFVASEVYDGVARSGDLVNMPPLAAIGKDVAGAVHTALDPVGYIAVYNPATGTYTKGNGTYGSTNPNPLVNEAQIAWSDKDVVVKGDGTTEVNVYLTRRVFQMRFDMAGPASTSQHVVMHIAGDPVYARKDDCDVTEIGDNHIVMSSKGVASEVEVPANHAGDTPYLTADTDGSSLLGTYLFAAKVGMNIGNASGGLAISPLAFSFGENVGPQIYAVNRLTGTSQYYLQGWGSNKGNPSEFNAGTITDFASGALTSGVVRVSPVWIGLASTRDGIPYTIHYYVEPLDDDDAQPTGNVDASGNRIWAGEPNNSHPEPVIEVAVLYSNNKTSIYDNTAGFPTGVERPLIPGSALHPGPIVYTKIKQKQHWGNIYGSISPAKYEGFTPVSGLTISRAGWLYDAEKGRLYQAVSGSRATSGDIFYFYRRDRYDIRFVSDGLDHGLEYFLPSIKGVQFEMPFGSSSVKDTLEANTKKAIEAYTANGYRFLGWYTDSDFAEAFYVYDADTGKGYYRNSDTGELTEDIPGIMPAYTVTLHAKTLRTPYTVTVIDDGHVYGKGLASPGQTADFGADPGYSDISEDMDNATITLDGVTYRSGARVPGRGTFVGWCWVVGGQEDVFDSDVQIHADATVFAVWNPEPAYRVVYDLDGGTLASAAGGSADNTAGATGGFDGETLHWSPSSQGNTWANANGLDALSTGGNVHTPIDLYAYKMGTGVMLPTPGKQLAKIGEDGAKLYFAGWQCVETGEIFTAGDTVAFTPDRIAYNTQSETLSGALHFRAVYAGGDEIRVTYLRNWSQLMKERAQVTAQGDEDHASFEEMSAMAPHSIAAPGPVSANEPLSLRDAAEQALGWKLTGYRFLGWSPDQGAQAPEARLAAARTGQTVRFAQTAQLYGVWELRRYSVTYDLNGGAAGSGSGTGVPMPGDDESTEGNDGGTGGDSSVPGESDEPGGGPGTDTDGGSGEGPGAAPIATLPDGDFTWFDDGLIPAETPVKEGYRFKGWYLTQVRHPQGVIAYNIGDANSEDDPGKSGQADGDDGSGDGAGNGDATQANGGGEPGLTPVGTGTLMSALLGGTGLENPDEATQLVLTALWEPIYYTVTFYMNNGTGKQLATMRIRHGEYIPTYLVESTPSQARPVRGETAGTGNGAGDARDLGGASEDADGPEGFDAATPSEALRLEETGNETTPDVGETVDVVADEDIPDREAVEDEDEDVLDPAAVADEDILDREAVEDEDILNQEVVEDEDILDREAVADGESIPAPTEPENGPIDGEGDVSPSGPESEYDSEEYVDAGPGAASRSGGTRLVPVGVDDPTWDNHSFLGWLADDKESLFDFAGTPILADTDIFASWDVHFVTVVLDPNGGAFADSDEPGARVLVWSEEDGYFESLAESGQTLPGAEDMVRDGYVFDGWYVEKEAPTGDASTGDGNGGGTTETGGSGSGGGASSGDTGHTGLFTEDTHPEGSLVVYARWKKLHHIHYLTGDADSGQAPVDENSYLSGDQATAADNSGQLEKEGYVFDGWESSDGKVYRPGDPIDITDGDITLTPRWKVMENVATFYRNDGTDNVVARNVFGYNDTLELPEEPTYAHHNFLHWADAGVGSPSEALYPPVPQTGGVDLDFYAIWEPAKYRVTFISTGDTAYAQVDVSYSDELGRIPSIAEDGQTLPNNPTRSGYTFKGWQVLSGEEWLSFDADTPLDGDTTVFAIWERRTLTTSRPPTTNGGGDDGDGSGGETGGGNGGEDDGSGDDDGDDGNHGGHTVGSGNPGGGGGGDDETDDSDPGETGDDGSGGQGGGGNGEGGGSTETNPGGDGNDGNKGGGDDGNGGGTEDGNGGGNETGASADPGTNDGATQADSPEGTQTVSRGGSGSYSSSGSSGSNVVKHNNKLRDEFSDLEPPANVYASVTPIAVDFQEAVPEPTAQAAQGIQGTPSANGQTVRQTSGVAHLGTGGADAQTPSLLRLFSPKTGDASHMILQVLLFIAAAFGLVGLKHLVGKKKRQ